MKKCLLLLLFLFVAVSVRAQIPNPGFEDWAGDAPVSWVTSNAAPYFPITPSTEAHSGTYAVQGRVVQFMTGAIIGPVIQSGTDGEGFAVNQRYAKVTGYYKLESVSGDMLALNFLMNKQGSAIALAATQLSGVSDYTYFEAEFIYQTEEVPDNCVLQISLVGPSAGNDYHLGSYFLVDDLAFTPIVGVIDQHSLPKNYSLAQNYPNPFNPTTKITFSIAQAGNVNLTIYNMLGQKVTVLIDGQMNAGESTVEFNATNLSSGIYYYKLSTANYSSTKKMMLLK